MIFEEEPYMNRRTTNTMRITPRSLHCVLFVTAFIIATMGACVPAAHAQDKGQRPAAHIGSFEWNGSVGLAVQTAEQVMKQAGLKVSPLNGAWETWGGSDKVLVVVTCAPVAKLKTRVVVLATSTDNDTAAFYRSDIRARIQKVVSHEGDTNAAEKAKPKDRTADDDERAATLKLKTAKALVDEDKKERAIQVLEDLVKKYPKSKAAGEAKELLDKLK
jgi:hypothetical protein